ncbi:MAG: hypothetical protein R3F39_17070 [Myxococcota bacterium]
MLTPSRFIASICPLALALVLLGSPPAAHAADSPARAKLVQVQTAQSKLRGSFDAAKIAPGPAPAGLKAVSADASALVSALGQLRTQAVKAGAKSDVLAKFDGVDGEAQKLASRTSALVGKKLTPIDVQALSSAMTKIQDDLAAVLGLLEPVITR